MDLRKSRFCSTPLAFLRLAVILPLVSNVVACRSSSRSIEKSPYSRPSPVEDKERRVMVLDAAHETLRLFGGLGLVQNTDVSFSSAKIEQEYYHESGKTTIPLMTISWPEPDVQRVANESRMQFRQDGRLEIYLSARASAISLANAEFLLRQRRHPKELTAADYLLRKSKSRKEFPGGPHPGPTQEAEANTSESLQEVKSNPFGSSQVTQSNRPLAVAPAKPGFPIIPKQDWVSSRTLRQRADRLLRTLEPVAWTGYKPFFERADMDEATYRISLEGKVNGLPCEGRRVFMVFEMPTGTLIEFQDFRVEAKYPTMTHSLLSDIQARSRAVHFLKREYGIAAGVRIRLHKIGIVFPDVPGREGTRKLDTPCVAYSFEAETAAHGTNYYRDDVVVEAENGKVIRHIHYGTIGSRPGFEGADTFRDPWLAFWRNFTWSDFPRNRPMHRRTAS